MKSTRSAILIDSKQLRQIDEDDFRDSYVQGGKFTLVEAELAIELMNLHLLGQGRTSDLRDLPVNSLKILLGLALTNQQEYLFDQVCNRLGEDIQPFLDSFKQAKQGYKKKVRYLFELTLKAAVAGCDTELTRTVLFYAQSHNYLISVDEKTAIHALLSTYHGRPMAGDYSLLRVLTDCQLPYKIAVTELNRKQIEEIRRRESGGEVKVNAFVIQSLNGSRATSKATSRANSRAVSR